MSMRHAAKKATKRYPITLIYIALVCTAEMVLLVAHAKGCF